METLAAICDRGRLVARFDGLRRFVLATTFPSVWWPILGENASVCAFLPLAVVLVKQVQAFRRRRVQGWSKPRAFQPFRSMPIMVTREEGRICLWSRPGGCRKGGGDAPAMFCLAVRVGVYAPVESSSRSTAVRMRKAKACSGQFPCCSSRVTRVIASSLAAGPRRAINSRAAVRTASSFKFVVLVILTAHLPFGRFLPRLRRRCFPSDNALDRFFMLAGIGGRL